MTTDAWFETLKFVGIAVTALLGAVGVLGDFRTADRRTISRLGYVMIAGVILSGVLAIVATAHDDHTEEERAATLALNTKTTVDSTRDAEFSLIRHIVTRQGITWQKKPLRIQD